MPKGNKAQQKAEQRYQLKLAKRQRDLPSTFEPVLNGNLRFHTLSQQFVAILLFTTAITSIQADAKKVRRREESCPNSAFTPYTKSSSISQCSSSEQPICNSQKMLGTHSVIYKCLPFAEQEYKTNPDLYHKDVATTHAMLEKLNRQQPVKCKVNQIVKDKRFHFAFANDKDLAVLPGHSVEAQYEATTSSLQLPVRMNDSFEKNRMLQHELHHAFISRENLETKRNYDPKLNIGYVAPCENEANKKIIVKHIFSGIENIRYYLNLLAKPSSRLNTEERIQLNRLKKATENYHHYIFTSFVRNEPSKKAFKQVEEYTANDLSVRVPLDYFASKKVGNQYELKSKCDVNKAQAALLDGVVLLANTFKNNPAAVLINEMDAYIHELYEPYPELFNLLFENLQTYHLGRNSQGYKSCLSKI